MPHRIRLSVQARRFPVQPRVRLLGDLLASRTGQWRCALSDLYLVHRDLAVGIDEAAADLPRLVVGDDYDAAVASSSSEALVKTSAKPIWASFGTVLEMWKRVWNPVGRP